MPAYNSVSDTSALDIFKEIYPVEEIAKLEQTLDNLWKEIPKEKNLKFSGRNDGSFVFAVKGAGPHGQKMVNQREAIPAGKPSVYEQGTAYVKEYVGVIEFTKRSLILGKENAGSFADLKMSEMDGLIINANKYFNRQVANGTGAGTITLIDGVEAIGQTTISVDDATPFQIGMVIDMYNAAGTTKLEGDLVVQDIDIFSTPNTITLANALTVASEDNSILCLAGVKDNAASDGKEMLGLPLVVDDGTLSTSFQGIVRTGAGEVPNYRGITLDANGAAISEGLIAQLFSRAHRVGGTKFAEMKDCYWALSPEQNRAYQALAISQYHFVPGQKADLSEPFAMAPVIAGKRAVVDMDIDRASAYLIKKDAIKIGVAHELDWEKDLGGSELKWLSGYLQGVMILYFLGQFFAESVREVAAIKELAAVAI